MGLKGVVFEDLDHALAKGYILASKKSTKKSRCYVGYGDKQRVVQTIKTKHIVKKLSDNPLGYAKGDGLGAHSPASAGSQPLDMNGDAFDFYTPDMPTSPTAGSKPKTKSKSRRKAARKKLRKQRDNFSDSSNSYGDLTVPDETGFPIYRY